MSLRKQNVRRFFTVLSALLFPVTMVYFSPGMVFKGARLGILSGSYITFALLFLCAIAFGRAWCGWLCPVAGFSDMLQTVNGRPYTTLKAKRVKYVIWAVWILAIAGVAIFVGGGFSSIDPFLGTEKGISIHSVSLMAVYYIVIGVIVTSSLLLGRRGFCHTLCWMAPFMVLGRKLANVLKLRSLRLSANDNPCSGCGQCNAVCPMSLPVQAMAEGNRLEHADCTLCDICASACPNKKLMISFCRPMKGSIDTHENE